MPLDHLFFPRSSPGMLKFDGWTMKARVVDLPCILESQKTMDKRTFYKTADVSQMVVCTEVQDEEEAMESSDSSDEDEGIRWGRGKGQTKNSWIIWKIYFLGCKGRNLLSVTLFTQQKLDSTVKCASAY